MGRKGIINFIEAIVVIVALFIAFAVLFPDISFKNRWSDATTILSSRDLILTMDRLNMIYTNSFDANSLQSFLDSAIPVNRSSLLAWVVIEGTVKSSIVVACNCSNPQIQNLNYWMSGLKMNGRYINITFIPSTLDNIVPSDALLIWNNVKLDSYLANFLNYLRNGGGIVEINDFDISQTGTVQKQIFGLIYAGGKSFNNQAYADHFSHKPNNSTDIMYEPYKYFFHIPVPLKASETVSSFPLEAGMQQPVCNSLKGHGKFIFNDTAYDFWMCNSTTVYFDTDHNASADTAVRTGVGFKIFGYNFTLQYIDIVNSIPYQIGVSFGYDYQFQDFLMNASSAPGVCPSGSGWNPYYYDQLNTVDYSPEKIIFNASFRSGQFIDLPTIITNNTGGRAAWIADFTNDLNSTCKGIAAVGDDEKLLLASLLLWGAGKETFSPSPVTVKNGFITKYVNVQNLDTYEVYNFNFGLGSPFGS